MGSRLSESSVKMLLQLLFIALNDIKSKYFSNTLRDFSVYIICCIRQLVVQELDKIHVLVCLHARTFCRPTSGVGVLEQGWAISRPRATYIPPKRF